MLRTPILNNQQHYKLQDRSASIGQKGGGYSKVYKQELRNACENNKIYLEFRMEEENISTALYLTSLYR